MPDSGLVTAKLRSAKPDAGELVDSEAALCAFFRDSFTDLPWQLRLVPVSGIRHLESGIPESRSSSVSRSYLSAASRLWGALRYSPLSSVIAVCRSS